MSFLEPKAVGRRQIANIVETIPIGASHLLATGTGRLFSTPAEHLSPSDSTFLVVKRLASDSIILTLIWDHLL